MKKLSKLIQIKFDQLCQTGKLFRSSITGREVWDLYIQGFKNDPTFRDPESSVHNCNHCKNFIRRYGNIVAINDKGHLISMFDVEADEEYKNSMYVMNKALINAPIKDVFFETFNELNALPYEKCTDTQSSFLLGIPKNIKRYTRAEAELFGVVKPNEIRTFNHFHLDIPKQFVNFTGESIEAIMAHYRDKYSVFKRAMEEIPLDTLNLVKDLINQGSLLDGTSHLHSVEEFIKYKQVKIYSDNWLWQSTYSMEERTAKFKNTLIGTLCTELAEGKELNAACQSWNKRVDPANYHKATAPITQRQIKEAQKFVEENDYEASFNRSLVTSKDIRIDEILHSNIGKDKIKSVSMFDKVKASSGSGRHKRADFDKVESISIEKFMKDIVPTITSFEAFLENRMQGNLCVLTKAAEDSKNIFKWNNPYSYTFNGNLAGKSQIKENVKSIGGNVEGIVRCSLQWNDKDTPGIVDFDLHCRGKNNIYYGNKGKLHSCGGKLDIDMINPSNIGIENIFWKNKMIDGNYEFVVRNYNNKTNTGFKIEIDMNGEIFHYSKSGKVQSDTLIALINVKNGNFTIKHHLPETNSSKEIWGLNTGEFHKINLACLSPNHWGENRVGNLHYMFMLDKCQAEGSIRSFHNEHLTTDLLKHRKVMEVLGATNMLDAKDYPKHLAGLGFNSTVKDELIVKCKGSFNRMLKIQF
ncbi:MAG: hypothetical protein GY775_16885 [Candidatus Scalindua sp.]|nr:hypothetical protein [Candidatus Scalindua sp.]